MHYMVIEQFKDTPAIYKRLREKGRMMPEGLNYVSSWIDHNLKTCWQVMETEDFVLARALDRQLERLDGVGNCSRPHFCPSRRTNEARLIVFVRLP